MQSGTDHLVAVVPTLGGDLDKNGVNDQVQRYARDVSDFRDTSRYLHKAARQNDRPGMNSRAAAILAFADRSIPTNQTLRVAIQNEIDSMARYERKIAGKAPQIAWMASGLAIGFLALFALIFSRDEARSALLEEARQIQSSKAQVRARPAVNNHDGSDAVGMPIDIDVMETEGLYGNDAMQQVLAYYEDLEQAVHDQEETSRILEEIDLDSQNADLNSVREKVQQAIEQSQRSANRVSKAVQAMRKISQPQPHIRVERQPVET